MKRTFHPAILLALLSAALYAVSVPMSKLLMHHSVSPTMQSAFLYLGAGIGMSLFGFARRLTETQPVERHLTREDVPCLIGMLLMDSMAPILLLFGLAKTISANASLLGNFEIAATALLARIVFKEAVSRRLTFAIGLIMLSSMILSIEDASSFQFSVGSLLIVLSCTCWGVENNFTRMLSKSDPLEIVVIKGFGAGLISLVVSFSIGDTLPSGYLIPDILLLGFVSYGLSIFFYVYAQRYLGAARTSAFYAAAPFIGVGLSLLIFRDLPSLQFWGAFALMAAGAYFAASDAD